MADWSKILSRGDVEDRRAAPLALGGLGTIGGLVFLAVSFFMNPDPAILQDIVTQLNQAQVTRQQVDPKEFAGADRYERFASAVIGSTNDMWGKVFEQNGESYNRPRLVLFRSATQSACGAATSSIGPHYCPTDKTIYVDETFFAELQRRFGAKGGDVAEAYILAHEVGHHVQNELGLLGRDNTQQAAIRTELQADCFAGVWAFSVARQGVLEANEINEALDAAAAVGDDRIQQTINGRVNPETWTHGSSEQRVAWFNRGFTTGRPAACQ